MNFFKFGFTAIAVALMAIPSANAQAQDLSTRRGAVAGAIIGGLIGDQNDRAFTGVVVGGLVGAAAGNAVSRTRQAQQFGYGGYGGGYGYAPRTYGGGGYGGGFGGTPVQVVPSVYRGGGGFYGGGFGGRSTCPYSRGW